jgi:hypothetical protein
LCALWKVATITQLWQAFLFAIPLWKQPGKCHNSPENAITNPENATIHRFKSFIFNGPSTLETRRNKNKKEQALGQ